MSPRSIIFFLIIFACINAYVSQNVKISGVVTVSKDGTGNFTSINNAIGAAPLHSDGKTGYFCIKIKTGIYQEYVVIGEEKTYLMITGDGINRTIITGSHNAQDGWSISKSATLITLASNFIGQNMSIRNTAGPTKGQAVALMNGGIFSVFYKCSFEGYQDTLFAKGGEQFYRDCDIYGTVDFIFGNAKMLLQKCNIYPRQAMKGQANEITAQGREQPYYPSGIIIHGCNIRPAYDLVKCNYTVDTYLGRPWRKYSRTIIMQSFMDGFIKPAGWDAWSGGFALDTLYYAEYNNTGPGSNTSNRVTWPGYHIINEIIASNFTVSKFIDGDSWLPQTKVPYIGGFILSN